MKRKTNTKPKPRSTAGLRDPDDDRPIASGAIRMHASDKPPRIGDVVATDFVTDLEHQRAGVVVGVFGNLVVVRENDGRTDAFDASEVRVVMQRENLQPDTAAAPMTERVVLPAGQTLEGGRRVYHVAKVLRIRESHHPDDEYPDRPSPEQMRAGLRRLDLAAQLIAQIEDLLIAPVDAAPGIGWKWCDGVAFDHLIASLGLVSNELDDITMGGRFQLAWAQNEVATRNTEGGAN